MDTNQPASTTSYAAPARGMFGTKIPSSVAFAIAVLLFLLPVAEIKCAGQKGVQKSGLDFAMGSKWKDAGGLGKEIVGQILAKMTGKKEGNAQYFAIAAFALGIIGLGLSSAGRTKSAAGGGIISGVLAAGCLIAIMVEVKSWFNDLLAKEALDKAKEGAESLGLGKTGDIDALALGFTPWFYVAIIGFLAAAFFCYKRMSGAKN